MADLNSMILAVTREGYHDRNAASRVCQDIILKAISASRFGDQKGTKGRSFSFRLLLFQPVSDKVAEGDENAKDSKKNQ